MMQYLSLRKIFMLRASDITSRLARAFQSNAVCRSEDSCRTNIAGIQMLPSTWRDRIFSDCRKTIIDDKTVANVKDHLKQHDLLDRKTVIQEPVDMKIPQLCGKNVDEHFQVIANQQVLPYRKCAEFLANCSLPPMPVKWIFRPGWTKYDTKCSKCYAVDFPDEDVLLLDVEVLMSEGNCPTIATAASSNAWYSWCSTRLFDNHSPRQKDATFDDLITFEANPCESDSKKARLVIGHNVSFDRSFLKEQYFVEGSRTRFLDTMSLHIAISGLTSLQRVLYIAKKAGSKRKEVVEHEDEMSKVGSFPGFEWTKESSLNNLNDIYQLYYKDRPSLKKHLRDIFISGSVADVNLNFQDLMTYCADDVKATHAIFCRLWPQFKARFPHPVTLGGMLEMSVAYLPVNDNWQKYIERSQTKYNELQSQLNSVLFKIATDASQLPATDYQNDLWLWDMDWSTKKVKVPSAVMDSCSFQNFKKQTCKSGTTYIHCPRWYGNICNNSLEPVKLTIQCRITPKLLRLVWDGFPLHFDATHGWGYLVPCADYVHELESGQADGDSALLTASTVGFPFKSLLRICAETKPAWFQQLSLISGQDKLLDDILNKIQSSTGNEEDLQKYWSELNVLKAVGVEPTMPKTEHSGDGPFLDVIQGCEFYKLPHKDGANKRVGNPLAKDFITKIEQGILHSALGSDAETVLKFGNMCSYWKNNVDRISSQMVIWLSTNELSNTVASDSKCDKSQLYGAIIPRVVTAGTVTRRAVERTWMTASNAYADRIGSELKAMIQSPPGYYFVGADVDSQELWIAAVLGDTYFCGVHGCTAFGWMTLQGNKSEGTDLHSRTAQLVGISREHAKIFNYGRIYGAGQKFAEQLLMKFNPKLTKADANQKAKTMFKATKGRRIRSKYTKSNTDSETPSALWEGGSESHMFNMLEQIARSPEPRTPVLNGLISKALEPRNVNDEFMTSRINWVVQSSAVDYLHLMLVCMRWLLDVYKINGRFCISIHDEVRYLVAADDRHRAALALQLTNLLTRSMFAFKLGFDDLPLSVAFFSSVDIDTCLRKEASLDCKTPSNPDGLLKGYGVKPGESLDIKAIMQKTSGKFV